MLTKHPNSYRSAKPGQPKSSGAAPEFNALRDLVTHAAHTEIRVEAGAPVAEPTQGFAAPNLKLPSGWYEKPAAPNIVGWPSEIRAAGFGLAAGLMLLVPVALWLNPAVTKRFKPQPDLAALASRLVADARAEASLGTDLLDLITGKTLGQADAAEPPELEEARQLIAAGDVVSARTALATAAAARSPQALFLMAETFDPNMLAAWGTRGVAADFERARSLYAAANALGHDQADSRLAALK